MKTICMASNKRWYGGRALARKLGIRYVNTESLYGQYKTIINWGCSGFKSDAFVLNRGPNVGVAVNKIKALRQLAPFVPCPELTESSHEAKSWNRGDIVLGRDIVGGKQGNGITVFRLGELNQEEHQYKFYTRYVPKKREFRFHVAFNELFWTQEKLKRRNIGDDVGDPLIRNDGRYVFAFKHLEDKPILDYEQGKRYAIKAIHCLGLHFGAVDIGWHPEHDWCIYEVNTAPGIEGTTLEKYAEHFNRKLRINNEF